MRFLPGAISATVLIASIVVGGFICCECALWPYGMVEANLAAKATSGLTEYSVRRVTWSADGRFLLARSRGVENELSLLTVHDLEDPANQTPVWTDPFGILTNDAALSPDGRNVFLSTERGELWWVNRDTSETIEPAKNASSFFFTVAVAHDGRRLAGSTDQGKIVICDLDLGSTDILMSPRVSMVMQFRFSGDDRTLLATRNDGSVQIWDLESRMLITEKSGEGSQKTAAEFVGDGTRVLSFHDGKSIEIWDTASGDVIWQGVCEIGGCVGTSILGVSSDGRTAALGSQGQRIVLWDVEQCRSRFDIENPSTIQGICFSPDGKLVAVAGREGLIRIYDSATGTQVRQLEISQRCASKHRI